MHNYQIYTNNVLLCMQTILKQIPPFNIFLLKNNNFEILTKTHKFELLFCTKKTVIIVGI